MNPRSLLRWLAVLACVALAACASAPAQRDGGVEHLFADGLFAAPDAPVDAREVFALSAAMRRFASQEMAALVRRHGAQRALVEALRLDGQLRLEYESTMTRNAAQAFEARSGNCLSLVIMTAAFAKELGLQVRYQSAYREETWSRKGNLLLRSGHVNLTLGRRLADHGVNPFGDALTIDFLPPADLRTLRTVEIPESLVVAMFMNNRAVEALVQERLDLAYAWAREALRTDPAFLAAHNTLGVIYLRRGALAEAGAVFEHVLARDPDHTRALANLAEVARRAGRSDDEARLRARLAQLEPEPPLHFFNLGLAAMQRSDYRAARDLFEKEAARGDVPAEVHYWLGVAHWQLGDVDQAGAQLALAAEASGDRGERDLYAAKLAWLRARQAR